MFIFNTNLMGKYITEFFWSFGSIKNHKNSPLKGTTSYLIFVISFTRAKFSENKIYNEKRVNYKKRISRQNSVNQDLLGQAMKKVCKTTH